MSHFFRNLVREGVWLIVVRRPERIYHVTVMPCYDKKLEASRPDFTTSITSPSSSSSSSAAASSSSDPSAAVLTTTDDSAMITTETTTTTVDVRDVDCVLTTGEVQRMLDDKGLDLATLALSPSPSGPTNGSTTEQRETTGAEESLYFPSLLSVPGTSSGGYLHNTIQAVLEGLTNEEIYATKLVEKKVRSEDYVEYTLVSIASTSALMIEGAGDEMVLDGGERKETTLLRAAKCYGFRNLQNVVRKIGRDAGVTVSRGAAGILPPSSSAAAATARRNAATALRRKKAGIPLEEEIKFDYVEVMACPSGCVNGGGQIAPPKFAVGRRNGKGRAVEGRLDSEGMPAMDEMMEEDGRVLSGKEWVARVEEVYWRHGVAPPPSSRALDINRIDPSLHPYLSSLQTDETERTIEGILERMTRGGNREERRKELLRTGYRAVVGEEVNGLAVVW